MSDRSELINHVTQQMEVYNSGASNPSEIAHNFHDIANDCRSVGQTEAANYFQEMNTAYNDAKHFNDVHFDKQCQVSHF
jgi:hypothetical protein